MATKSLVTELKSSPSPSKLWGSCRLKLIIVNFFAILILLYQRHVLGIGFVCQIENEPNITNHFGVSTKKSGHAWFNQRFSIPCDHERYYGVDDL